jgi:cyclohexyl-isocyanide hydratase
MEQHQAPLQIGMLLYPGLTLLDLIGPQTVWSWHAKIHLVWKTQDLIVSDSGVAIQPTTTFADCPHDLDILFVPGGFGTAAAMQDRAVLDFLAARAAHAKYVTSVCSGSLILGAAGLLQGYKATSHWASRDILPLFGAEPVEARVVVDRNRITGGGVTAGIDFGLVLLAKLRGDDVAKVTQLAMEYDPEPPFHAGSSKSAGPAVVELTMSYMESADLEIRQAAAEVSKGMSK